MEDLAQLKNAIIGFARTMNSGAARAFQDFILFRKGNAVGAAVSTGETPINIHNVRPGQSYLLEGDFAVPCVSGNFLTLTVDVSATDLNDPLKADAFSNMILQFVSTKDGNRERLLENPWVWAEKIIEMCGDKTAKMRPHAYITELYLTAALKDAGLLTDIATEYRGPEAGRHDFELPSMSLEAKSHLHGAEDEKPGELVVSSETQLSRTDGKPLYVVYFSIEDTGGLSLASCVGRFPDDRVTILQKLADNGFVEGDFYWQRPYNLPHEPRVYEITDDFPRITPEQFKGDVFPSGVTKLVYHVSLRNLPYCPLGAFIKAIASGQQPVFSVAGE